MRWATLAILAVVAILLAIVALTLWPEIQKEMPQTAMQVEWFTGKAVQFYEDIPAGVKLTAAVLICVGGFYLAMSYFMGVWTGIKRF